jgi:hypothetical protein
MVNFSFFAIILLPQSNSITEAIDAIPELFESSIAFSTERPGAHSCQDQADTKGVNE